LIFQYAEQYGCMVTSGRKVVERLSIWIIPVVGVGGALLALQGWRSRLPNGDLLTTIESAHEFVQTGRFPEKGVLTSFASFTPPGATWLMIPGTMAFTDPRLFEYIGSLALYLGTLVGIFLLARLYFGWRCAALSVALYGFSAIGLSVAGSLWQRYPIHFFYIWTIYWTSRWAIQRREKYLIAAVLTWALGMYVFMEIAPAFFVVPALWFLYRPPMTWRTICITGGVIGVIWYPYLRFEHQRNFADLKSQVLRQKILPAEFSASWCNPALILKSLESSPNPNPTTSAAISATAENIPTNLSVFTHVWERVNLVVAAALSNFQYSSLLPASAPLLAGLLTFSLIVLAVSTLSAETAEHIDFRSPHLRYWCARLAVAMVVCALMANEFIATRYISRDGVLEKTTISIIRSFQLFLMLGGIALLTHGAKILAILGRAVVGLTAGKRRTEADLKMILLGLMIPWAILLATVEGSAHLERFLWLWPLQIMILAALVTYIPQRLNAARSISAVASLSLLLLLNANPLLTRAKAWYTDGWFGSDPDQVRVVHYVSSRLDGKGEAAIGYQTFISRFMAMFHAVDPRYKVGAEFDLFFKDRYGITNTNNCGEGMAPSDDFRIVQTAFNWTDLTGKGYFERGPNTNFVFLKEFGPYQVFQRQ